jgi:hypothetical protein
MVKIQAVLHSDKSCADIVKHTPDEIKKSRKQ